MELGLDPTLPNVELVLKGKLYHLCFDFNAIVRAEKETGLDLLNVLTPVLDATHIRAMLWAALLHEQPHLTITEAGSLITLKRRYEIEQAIIDAWIGSLPEPDKDEVPGEETAQISNV